MWPLGASRVVGIRDHWPTNDYVCAQYMPSFLPVDLGPQSAHCCVSMENCCGAPLGCLVSEPVIAQQHVHLRIWTSLCTASGPRPWGIAAARCCSPRAMPHYALSSDHQAAYTLYSGIMGAAENYSYPILRLAVLASAGHHVWARSGIISQPTPSVPIKLGIPAQACALLCPEHPL